MEGLLLPVAQTGAATQSIFRAASRAADPGRRRPVATHAGRQFLLAVLIGPYEVLLIEVSASALNSRLPSPSSRRQEIESSLSVSDSKCEMTYPTGTLPRSSAFASCPLLSCAAPPDPEARTVASLSVTIHVQLQPYNDTSGAPVPAWGLARALSL